MYDTAGEARTNSLVTFSNGLLHTDVPVLFDQPKAIDNSYV